LKVENKIEKKVFSIFEHELVPKHIVLSKEEAEEVLKKYHIKPYQLPYIKKNDPAVKEIGAMPGDIIKIIRKSPTAGEAVVYRYVIE
jgi:DNA-directed RNA polymerase subunit H